MASTVKVEGLRELIRAADAAGKETKRAVRARLRKVGEIIRDDARGRFSRIDSGSAAGFGVSVRRAGLVSVEQRRKRVTGKRPDFGSLQMRDALVPALDAKEATVAKEFEQALDDIADTFERS